MRPQPSVAAPPTRAPPPPANTVAVFTFNHLLPPLPLCDFPAWPSPHSAQQRQSFCASAITLSAP